MKRFLPLGLALVFPLMGFAIVSPSLITSETDPLGSQGLDWDGVVNFNSSSAVAIAPRWLITAAHVADDFGNTSFNVGGTTFNQIGEVYHPVADFALIEVDADLPTFYQIYTDPLVTSTTPTDLRDEVLMVGYGGIGALVDATNFNVNTVGRGTKRWAHNRIDAEFTYVGGFGNTNDGFQMFFDTSDSPNEGGGSIGDSGGAVFIDHGGTWELAGVMADVSTAGPFDSTLAISTQEYTTFIYSVIPEVSSIWMMAGGLGLMGFALGLKRRR